MIQTMVTARRIKTGITVQVYKVADTQPATPSGTAIPPGGWSTAPPSSGRIWVSTATAVNNKVSSSWSTPVRWNGNDGAKGDSGVPGQSIRISEWVPGAEFHNDNETVTSPRYLDVALVYASNGVISRYECKSSHTATEQNKPGTTAGNALWRLLSGNFPLYTPLLVADNGDIKFLQSNRILTYSADGKATGGMSGDGYFWMGGANPSNAKSVDRADGSGIRAGGNISWDSNGNTQITGKITANSGKIGGFTLENGSLYWKGYDYFGGDSRSVRLGVPQDNNSGMVDISFNAATNGKYGVKVIGSTPGGACIYASSKSSEQQYPISASTYAAYFDGSVHINGNMFCETLLSNIIGTGWTLESDGTYKYRKGITGTIRWQIKNSGGVMDNRYSIEVVNGIIVSLTSS